jgi:hypothetical protein
MVNIYSDFLEAGKLVAEIIGIQNAKIENEKFETLKVGVDYETYYTAKGTKFNFCLHTEQKWLDLSKWQALGLSLYFYNDFDLCQLSESRIFKHSEIVDIKEWASKVAQKYVILKKSNDLNFMFGDRDIRVRGIAGVTNSTLIEFIIILKGYIAWGSDRLLVYRFHHGKGSDESFSYAFFVESRHFIYDYSFWCVFPTFVAMSGGTSHGGYVEAEAMLNATKKSLKLTIIDIYVTEENFLNFLQEKNVPFKAYDDLFKETSKKHDPEKKIDVDNQAKTLLLRLKCCHSGKKMWRDYENLIKDIFQYLFSPPLDNPKVQNRTADGLEIRDLIFPNHVSDGFWNEIRNEYRGSYIVVEAKNKEKPNQKDVLQVADYLNEKQVGLLGILVSRKLSKSALEKRRKYYSNDHKMIVLLDDNDITEMILNKSDNKKAEDILAQRIDSYRIQYEY